MKNKCVHCLEREAGDNPHRLCIECLAGMPRPWSEVEADVRKRFDSRCAFLPFALLAAEFRWSAAERRWHGDDSVELSMNAAADRLLEVMQQVIDGTFK